MDDAVDPTRNKSSCGGVIRNECAAFLGGFAKNLGQCSVLEAELWGIYEGLNLAWEAGLRNIILESDSVKAVPMVKSMTQERNPFASTVCKIKENRRLPTRTGMFSSIMCCVRVTQRQITVHPWGKVKTWVLIKYHALLRNL